LPEHWSALYAVSSAAFRTQLDILVADGWRAVLPEALAVPPLPAKCVVITFDDGHSSDLLAARELRERGLQATFFITWSRLGCPGFLDRKEVLQLDREGFNIGSHGLNHVPFAQLAPEELRRQLAGSRQQLQLLLGKPVTDLALPFGSYDGEVITAAMEAGYRGIMTSEFALAIAGRHVLARLAVTPLTTPEAFRALMAGRWIGIARQRLVNGMTRRITRFRAAAGF
jgi:peptidoglycan/xylan/chitin deacetylase (PgdA/CDA1 family)